MKSMRLTVKQIPGNPLPASSDPVANADALARCQVIGNQRGETFPLVGKNGTHPGKSHGRAKRIHRCATARFAQLPAGGCQHVDWRVEVRVDGCTRLPDLPMRQ
jgi:hypothetical protein